MKTDFINISELRVQYPFSSIFPIGNETLESISQNMETNGFDEIFPIIAWEGKNIVVDGHTRFAAAKSIGLEEIPVMFKAFENEDDAVLYCFHVQRNRRNMSDDDILNCLALLDTIDGSTKVKNKEGSKHNRKETNEIRAKELGISSNKVDKARKVMEHGNEKIQNNRQRKMKCLYAHFYHQVHSRK